jgi:hypothetical protein
MLYKHILIPNMKYSIFPCLLLAVFFISCHPVTETTLNGGVSNGGNGNPDAWVVPGLGTTYIYEDLDPNNLVVQSDTITVTKTGQHVGGKTNVTSLIDQFEGQKDSTFDNVDPNGDFSFGSPSSLDSLGNETFSWETYPSGSRLAINVFPPIDTILNNGSPNGEHAIRSDVKAFVGVENLSIPAGTFSTLHIRETNTSISTFPNDSLENSSNIETTDIWFAPSAGYYVKYLDIQTANGQTSQNDNIQLIKFLPK